MRTRLKSCSYQIIPTWLVDGCDVLIILAGCCVFLDIWLLAVCFLNLAVSCVFFDIWLLAVCFLNLAVSCVFLDTWLVAVFVVACHFTITQAF